MVVVGEDKNVVVVDSGKVVAVVCLFTVLCVEVVDDGTAKVLDVVVVTAKKKREQLIEIR